MSDVFSAEDCFYQNNFFVTGEFYEGTWLNYALEISHFVECCEVVTTASESSEAGRRIWIVLSLKNFEAAESFLTNKNGDGFVNKYFPGDSDWKLNID